MLYCLFNRQNYWKLITRVYPTLHFTRFWKFKTNECIFVKCLLFIGHWTRLWVFNEGKNRHGLVLRKLTIWETNRTQIFPQIFLSNIPSILSYLIILLLLKTPPTSSSFFLFFFFLKNTPSPPKKMHMESQVRMGCNEIEREVRPRLCMPHPSCGPWKDIRTMAK